MSDPARPVRALGLRKRFAGEPVLRGIDLAFEPGEITVLMGPNGDGKTVLLCCLGGGLRPSAGRALIEGRPAHRAGSRASLLLQGSVGLPALTGPETARFYAALHPAATGTWSRLLDRFDMTDTDTLLKHCSAGMRRKVELAVALDPDVPAVLLDEPTAALDLGSVHALHRVLRERRNDGAAVVLTSHAPLDIRLGDRLVFIHHGTVVADGRPERLMAELPPVVRLHGAVHEAIATIRPRLRGGHCYGSGAELRGFLPADSAVSELRAALGEIDVTVARVDPTPRDLYENLAAIRTE
ncbi:MAG: ATP-binding cassette domain-containing protein [Halobacteriales archaeon]